MKVVLFDLDGTLLPMDQDKFVGRYFRELTLYMCENNKFDPNEYGKAIWQGVKAMLMNDNSVNNEEAYFNEIAKIYGQDSANEQYAKYTEFYLTKYIKTKEECWYTEKSKSLVNSLKEKGVRIALATNPVFPTVATNMRMGWVNLQPEDFELVTTCNNIGYSKPNREYYLEITKRMGVLPQDCLMVGNDVEDDMVASEVGMDVFLLTDCLINKKGKDISTYPQGSFEELKNYIRDKYLIKL